MSVSSGRPRIREDCRHVRWDRPCAPHKSRGQTCDGCPDYSPTGKRIAIVKLDAMGDVLRTTCVLEGLEEKYRDPHITWITREESIPLLQHNPFIDRIVAYGTEALAVLLTERFDLVFNPDASPASAALATLARAETRTGLFVSEAGRLLPTSEAAEGWMLMGMRDDLKKANRRTYQEILLDMLGLTPRSHEIILELTDAEREKAQDLLRRKGVRQGRLILGLNAGAGEKWKHKQWTVSNCVDFVRLAREELDPDIVLLGGPSERQRNREIADRAKGELVDTGCDNKLREFLALIDACDALVTSDSLGLHAALALGKKVVALFGPTSAAEIDIYGRGVKVVAEVPCRTCYLPDCDRSPTCMDSITPEAVLEALKRLL